MQKKSSSHQKTYSPSKKPPNKYKQDGHKNVIPGAKKTLKSAINSILKKNSNQQISKKDLWCYVNQILKQNKTENKRQFGALILIKTFVLIFNRLQLKQVKKVMTLFVEKMKRKKGSHPNQAYLKKKKEQENRVIDAFEILNKPDYPTQKTIYQCLYKLFFYPKNRQNAVQQMETFLRKYALRYISSDQYISQQKNIFNEQKKQINIQNKQLLQIKVRQQQSFDFDLRLKDSWIQEQKMGNQTQKVNKQAYIINRLTNKIEMYQQKYMINGQEQIFMRQQQKWDIHRHELTPLISESELQEYDKKQLKNEQNQGLVLIESSQFICPSQYQYAYNKNLQQCSLFYDMFLYESTREKRNDEQTKKMQQMKDDNNSEFVQQESKRYNK